MTRAFTVLFCVAGFCSALMAPAYLKSHHVDRGEYYALLLFSAAGMMLMVAAGDLITFFVALEIQSVAIYALAGYLRRSPRSAEAGMKYFLIGAFATGILLYGIALVYGATGTTKLTEIGAMIGGSGASVAGLVDASQQAALVAAAGFDESVPAGLHDFGGMLMHVPLLSIGVVLIVVGFGIKLAAVPFHMWAPDVYTGSPTPIVGFMAAAVKVAGFGALVRIISLALFDGDLRMGPTGWVQVTFWMALLSMVVGNLAAVVQTNVKRMLAFSFGRRKRRLVPSRGTRAPRAVLTSQTAACAAASRMASLGGGRARVRVRWTTRMRMTLSMRQTIEAPVARDTRTAIFMLSKRAVAPREEGASGGRGRQPPVAAVTRAHGRQIRLPTAAASARGQSRAPRGQNHRASCDEVGQGRRRVCATGELPGVTSVGEERCMQSPTHGVVRRLAAPARVGLERRRGQPSTEQEWAAVLKTELHRRHEARASARGQV